MTWSLESRQSETLRGQRVLIVDDETVIALELEFAIGDAGAVVVGPAGNLDDALELAQSEVLSAAVLDVRLGGQTIEPVAQALAERGVPFLFYSGQVLNDAIRARWPTAAYVAKPAPSQILVTALAKLVADRKIAPPPVARPAAGRAVLHPKA